MHKNLLVLLIFPIWLSHGYGQGSNVPDSVRAMIERSQAGDRFEQTARMQVSVQFGEFLANLSGDEQRTAQIEAAFIEVLSERAQFSSEVTTGQSSPADLQTVSSYDYLRARLAPLLSTAELAVLDSQRNGPSDAQLKNDYAAELSRTSPGLSETNRELVLDTLIKRLRPVGAAASAAGQLSVDELVAQQIRSLIQVSEELQAQLTGEQLQQAINFLNQLQSNLYMNRSMSDPAQ